MPNYFSELLLKPSNTIVKVKDENAQNSITNLTANLQTEITNRSNADTQLQSNIDTEASAREQADTQLQGNINAEKLARQQADIQLQNNIDNIRDRVVNTYRIVNDMINDETLANGDYVQTLGYYECGIGGAIYHIENTLRTGGITLTNNLYANIVIDNVISTSQLGIDSTHDATQKLHNAISLVGNNGIINIDSDVTINSTLEIDISSNYDITINGNNHIISIGNNFNSTRAIYIHGEVDSYINHFAINDLTVKGKVNKTNITGIYIDNLYSELLMNNLNNVVVIDFKIGIWLLNTRLVKIDNMSIWTSISGSTGIIMQATNDKLVGDYLITGGQISATNGGSIKTSIEIQLAENCECAFKLNEMSLYSATETNIKAQIAGSLIDTWINQCQFDGSTPLGIKVINTGSSGRLYNLNVHNCYASAIAQFINIYFPAGQCKAIDISKNYIIGSNNDPVSVNANNCSINITDNQFIDCANDDGGIVNIYNSEMCVVSDNCFELNSGYTYNVVKIDSSNDNAIVHGNIGKNISNTAYIVNATNSVSVNNLPS